MTRHFGVFSLPAIAALCVALGGCGEAQKPAARAPKAVFTQVAAAAPASSSVELTGEIKARVASDLSFRSAGRIAARFAEVGDKVAAGQVLATIDTATQAADINSAEAGLQSAEANLRLATANFERQKTLMANGFTTQGNFDNANQALKAAQSTLENAKAASGTAREQLAFTSLRADAAGVIIARNAEVGQVVEAAQPIFTFARDGDRDAVFNISETLLTRRPVNGEIEVRLLSNPQVKALGKVREIAPTIDAASGTVRVKIGLESTPPEMGLGSPVAGVGRFLEQDIIALPWTAFFVKGEQPAVWVVDPATKAVALKAVVVESYASGEVRLRGGLAEGEIVVVAGAQLLRPGEVVAPLAAPPGMAVGGAK